MICIVAPVRGITSLSSARSFSIFPVFRFGVHSKNRTMTTPDFDDSLVERLFPAPTFASAFTSPSAPTPNAGVTPESTATLRRLLIENHKRFHIFFNDKGFHNHLSHHLFAAYGIGAPGHVLQAAFDEHAEYQRPSYKSPEPITHENWRKHLGNEEWVDRISMKSRITYLRFGQLLQRIYELLLRGDSETWANWAKDEARMLDRFMSGLLHPLIHFGHAAEFGVEGMAVEGLAQAAVHKTAYEKLYDASYFNPSNSTGSYLASLTSALSLASSNAKPQHTHAFTILARILEDDRLEAGKTCAKDSTAKFTDTINSVGDIIREYASLWKVSEDEKEIQERVEELAWLVTLMFGIGGWKKDPYRVHLVTSDLFIPSILSLLKPADKVVLLRAYFPILLGYFVSRGRPVVDVKGFFSSVTVDPKPEHSESLTDSSEPVGNPWYTLLTHTVPHRDEHHVKAERALAHSAALYGTRAKGHFSHTELKGAEEIDGTLFIRTGGLLMGALKWIFELEKEIDDQGNDALWSRDGLGWD
ncbi:hypothetical protein AG1IA_07374 [Rhizoctonia solani AG-1 IA]|uniref:Oxidoreductase AflY n=1 Tax=Thanatephorus cucumeris (strain AG1-IA) TaxID=983506 RepID=L8WK77_THACA|nr:hypothetical protein AG1IA_07374 [Rhizoctonia solani AG-1 IA]